MGDEKPARGLTLAEKLDRLFKTFPSSDGDEHTYREVADGINAMGGTTISWAYVHQLRTGKKDDPRKSHMEALARFFDVPPEYFFDEQAGEDIYAELALLAAMRDTGIHQVAARERRLKELSPKSKLFLAGVIQQLGELDKVDEPGTQAGEQRE